MLQSAHMEHILHKVGHHNLDKGLRNQKYTPALHNSIAGQLLQ